MNYSHFEKYLLKYSQSEKNVRAVSDYPFCSVRMSV